MATPNFMPFAQATSPAFESLLKLWMLPTQIGLGFMESSLNMMMGAMPAAHAVADRSGEHAETIARAAEEQVAHLDDGPDTIPTPAGLVA